MSPLVVRAELLLNQQRYDDAAAVLREALVQAPENAHLHSLVAISLAQINQFDEATGHAQQAIELAPDSGQSHFSLAWVMAERRRWKEARRAIDAAISLAPQDARFHWLLSRVHYCQHRWRDALDAAEQGLRIEPHHQGCLHMRGVAHLALGKKAEAAETIEQSLTRRPENAWAHASQGWLQLTQNKPRGAMDSFREALRLDPNLEWARQGLVEALKAHHWLYRGIMKFRLASSPLPDSAASVWQGLWYRVVRLTLIAGWVLSLTCCIFMPLAAAHPLPPPPLWYWLMFGVGLFSFLAVVLIGPIGNLCLLVHPWGRHVLSQDESRGARLLAASPLLPALVCALAIAGGDLRDLAGAMMLAAVAVPWSFLFRCHKGWPRMVAAAIVISVTALGLAAALPIDKLLSAPHDDSWRTARTALLLMFLYAIFLGSAVLFRLSRVEPKR